MEDLQDLRRQIDEIDRRIVSFLNQRYEVVKKVGEWKIAHNQPIYVPERERMLLEKLEKLNPGLVFRTVESMQNAIKENL